MPRGSRKQLPLPLGAVHNSELFSNHWLANRLPLEPEWAEHKDTAKAVLGRLLELWKLQSGRVEQYGSEQGLEQAFIQPALQILGWKLIYQTHLRGRRPDYALFVSDKELDSSLAAGRLSADFWKYPALLADAKIWNASLDKPIVVDQQREYPPEQIEWYLNNSELNYAILTNGKTWRLIPRKHDPGQPRFQTYLDCDLSKLLDDGLKQPATLFNLWPSFDEFLRFFLLFSPVAFVQRLERTSLIERARNGSSEYRLGVGEGLKQRVFDALDLCLEGFLSYRGNDLDPQEDKENCRVHSLILLYRLLFVLFAEDRKLLPFRVDRAYTDNRSLGRFRDEIAAKLDRIEEGRDADYPLDECNLWPDLLSLFDLIDKGAGRYKVPAYNGGLFDPELHSFLVEKKLPDRYLARVIDRLGRAVDPVHPNAGLVRVDYRDLAIQHLGNVYEGLLELRPHFADQEMLVIQNRRSPIHEEKVVPSTARIPQGFEDTGKRYPRGSVYLLTEKDERRATGSYYTPNNIVDYIVENTLGPLCEQIDSELRKNITGLEEQERQQSGKQREDVSGRLETLRSSFADHILRLRVLDPAMGSGHFLIRACQYLAEQIATNPNTKDRPAEHIEGDEPTLRYWKRRVVETCLYGVDRNPMAVELAKLALWLETVAIDKPLTFLDHHLRHGDSLLGASIEALRSLPDAPPLMSNLFEQQIKESLPGLLAALAHISGTPSNTIEQVKEKDKLFRKKIELIREPFRQTADLWCSTFFVSPTERLSLQEYENMLKLVNLPSKFARLLDGPKYRKGLEVCGPNGIAAFHWELEFPEAFFDASLHRTRGGFDAIIGNPPYDVLAEKETGRELSSLKSFLKRFPKYAPSFVGKNNLYKLFICQSLNLLVEDGRLGFITPMPVLGDEQASGIRKEILRIGAFTNVQAFPQKDNPAQRVFRDAKLSTAIVVVHKSSLKDEQSAPFVLRVNSTNEVNTRAATLRLTTADIPLYDPVNLTITSCSQEDWDLAVRIMRSGRLLRLGEVCTSYQGEVNETNEKEKGTLSENPGDGPVVLRGSNVCLYILREASQGDDLHLRVSLFRKGKSLESKAFHTEEERVGFQRSSPQNNFRRVIACSIPSGEYCFDTVSYIPASASRLPLLFLLGLLNTKLVDWYFRLGSTNSKVNEYQFNILPVPNFLQEQTEREKEIGVEARKALRAGKIEGALAILSPLLREAPFSLAVQDAVIDATRTIIAYECKRGKIQRNERSSLSPQAQPYQDFVDSLIYALAGLAEGEIRDLEQRLTRML